MKNLFTILFIIFSFSVFGQDNRTSLSFSNMASLQGLVGAPGLAATVKGFYNPADGGQGDFWYDATCTDAAFPGMVIRPTGVTGPGGWRRRYTGAVHSSWIGLVSNNSSLDQSSLISSFLNTYLNTSSGVFMDTATYYCKNMFVSNINNIKLNGAVTLKSFSTSAFGTSLITFQNCNNIAINGINFDGNFPVVPGSETGGTRLIQFIGDSGIYMSNCRLRQNGFNAIALYNNHKALFYNLDIDTTDCGIITFGGNDMVYVDHVRMSGGTSEGIVFWGLSGTVPGYDHDCHATSCTVRNKPALGEARFVDLFSFEGCTSINNLNGIYGTNVNGGGANPGQPNSAYNPRNGLIVNNIDSNSALRPFSGPFTNVDIKNNHIFSSLGYGIRVANPTDTSYNVTISNNYINGFSLSRTGLAGEGITLMNCFKCYVQDNLIISDSANTCLHIATSDSVWVENNKCFSVSQYQYDASQSHHIYMKNNIGNWHGPFANLLSYQSSNYFMGDTAYRSTDTTNFKPMTWNKNTGQIATFSNWSNLVGQNLARLNPTFQNRLFTPSQKDSVLLGYTSTGNPNGVFNVLGLSDFKGGVQGTWIDTVKSNFAYSRMATGVFQGGNVYNPFSYSYVIDANSVGNNTATGMPLFMTNNQNGGTNTLFGFQSTFTQSGHDTASHTHFRAVTNVSSGDSLKTDIGFQYVLPAPSGLLQSAVGLDIGAVSSSNVLAYTGINMNNSNIASGANYFGIKSDVDSANRLKYFIYHQGTAHSFFNGHVGIGTAVDTGATVLHVGGNSVTDGNAYVAGPLNIGITNGAGSPSAALSIISTSQGVLLPRMTTTQKLAIVSPAEGLLVYDLTLHQMSYWNGTTWINF